MSGHQTDMKYGVPVKRKPKRDLAFVPVLGADRKPLMPCSGRRARQLLDSGRARVFRRMPFTIILRDRTQSDSVLQPIALKMDPGYKTTGMATVREDSQGAQHVLTLTEITHRRQQIVNDLTTRTMYRKDKRSRLQYRKKRYLNRKSEYQGYPPSLRSAVGNILTWVNRYRRMMPITRLTVEDVKFDTQMLEDPGIQGEEYQQGTLEGYTVREYLLEKYRRTCVYCDGKSGDPKLQIEHVVPRSKGGTNRIGNLTLACSTCNQAKGNMSLEEYLKGDQARLTKIKKQLNATLKSAAGMNSMRNYLVRQLEDTGLPLEKGSGGLTKYNRSRMDIPKTHALDAACVGYTTALYGWLRPWLSIKASGRGSRVLRILISPKVANGVKVKGQFAHRARTNKAFGFQTGDIVLVNKPARACTPAQCWVGHVSVRQRGDFSMTSTNLEGGKRKGFNMSHRACTRLQRTDGYRYMQMPSMYREHNHSNLLTYG